jgi:hypothetical protein
MRITIHQPEFLPYLGFFQRLANADIFIILDDVGYEKNGFINRNKIKTQAGSTYITIPVLGRSPNKKINEVLIDNSKNWQESLLDKIKISYSFSPFFNDYYPFLKDVLCEKWEKISDLDICLIENIIKFLDLTPKIEISSLHRFDGQRTERLVNICKKFNADTYLSGSAGKDYIDLSLFEKSGIKVIFQEFSNREYSQLFPENGFLPYMSIMDLLFNEGKNSIKIIRKL